MSEAFGYGIPTVTTTFSAASYRISEESDISCVGIDVLSLKNCVIDVYNDETKWDKIQKSALNFIQQTQNRDLLQQKWSKVIESGMKLNHDRKKRRTDRSCVEGEEEYKRKYPEVAKLVENGMYSSAYGHWTYLGRREGRIYACEDEDHPLFKVDFKDPPICNEGEDLYLKMYSDVRKLIDNGEYQTGHEHWVSSGAKEGRNYFCNEESSSAR